MPDVRCVPFDACVYGGPRTTLAEILWTVATGMALALQVVLMARAAARYRAVKATGRNGVRLAYLFGVARNQALLAFAQLLLFIPGITAVFLPAAILTPVHESAAGIIVILEVASIVLLAVAVFQWRDSKALAAAAARQPEGGTT